MNTAPIFDFIKQLEDLHGISQKNIRELEEGFESCLFQCVAESPEIKDELPIIERKIKKAYERICSIKGVKLTPEHAARLNVQRLFAKKSLDCLKQYLPSSANVEIVSDSLSKQSDKDDTHNNVDIVKAVDTGWYTVDEVCTKYKLSKNNVKNRKWREKVGFPTHQTGGAYSRVSFSSAEVEEWLTKHKKL